VSPLAGALEVITFFGLGYLIFDTFAKGRTATRSTIAQILFCARLSSEIRRPVNAAAALSNYQLLRKGPLTMCRHSKIAFDRTANKTF